MPGGLLTARLMRKARQPADTADYRVFGVAVSFDPVHFPIYPGGAVKFVGVPGAPVDGVVGQFPSAPNAGTQLLMFPLRLCKEGTPDDTITVNTVLYRKQVDDAEDGDGDEGMAASAEGEGADDEAGGEMEQAGGDDGGLPQLPQWVLEPPSTPLSNRPAASCACAPCRKGEPPRHRTPRGPTPRRIDAARPRAA